jgi:hypothetical protein
MYLVYFLHLYERRRSRAEREVVPQHPRRRRRPSGCAASLAERDLKLRRDGATHAEHADLHHTVGPSDHKAMGNSHWTCAGRRYAGLGTWAN